MAITGADFENLIKPYFRKLFSEMGFLVIQVRKQSSGTQNGFDISVKFIDDDDCEREFFIECKYYTSAQLEWSDILNKQVQLDASNQNPTAFILLSPIKDLSNIDHDLQARVINLFKLPVDFWTPDKDVEKIFIHDEIIYEKIFGRKYSLSLDKQEELNILKAKINLLIQKKDSMRFINEIIISDSDNIPNEQIELKTKLDEKLNTLFDDSENDIKLNYHRMRANYKVYLESLLDNNNELRGKIINLEDNMRLKADRLTMKFKIDTNYTPLNFFFDFFDVAEKEINTFFNDYEFKGDRQKLLNGIVFELAAKCPLDWRKYEFN